MMTLVNPDREFEITRSLNTHVFHTVHGRPHHDYRHNISLYPVFQGPKSNVINVNSTSIRLPSSGRWFIYGMHCNAVMDINLPMGDSWVSLEEYGNETHVDIRPVVVETRRVVPRGSVHILKNPKEHAFLLAIRKDDIVGLLPDSSSETVVEINVNIYYHQRETDFSIRTFRELGRRSVKEAFYAEASKEPDIHRQVYVDGKLTDFHNEDGTTRLRMIDIPDTAVCEIVTDSTIIGKLEIRSDDETSQYKGKDNQTRVLCHIPKAWNPEMRLLTRDMIDVFVRINNTESIYIDRTNTDRDFGTITHQDIGICKILIDRYKLDAPIVVYVRTREDEVQMWRDPDYRLALYHLDDDLIVDNLLGKTPMKIWEAGALEGSRWTDFVDHCLRDLKTDDLSDLIKGYGYLNSADAVCDRTVWITILPELQKRFYVPVPECYLDSEEMDAHVFLHGRMIDKDRYRCERWHQFLILDFDNLNGFQPGERLAIEFFERSEFKCRPVTIPPFETVTLSVDQDVEIYRVYELNDWNVIPDKRIYKRFNVPVTYLPFIQAEYEQFVTEEEQDDGTVWLTIRNTTPTEMSVLVTSKHTYQKIYGVEINLKAMNYDIWCSHLLTVKGKLFPLVEDGTVEEIDEEETLEIPYLDRDRNALVYLNGRELTRGLDYEQYAILSSQSCIGGQFVVIQNSDYLRMLLNRIEVYAINERQVAYDTGFLTEHATESVLAYLSYFPNIGSLFVDGVLTEVTEDSRMAVPTGDNRNGANYKIRALIPECLSKTLDQYGTFNQKNLKTVVAYMDSVENTIPELVIIPHSHHIYSTYLQTITEAVLRKWIKVNPKWDDAAMLRIISEYDDMKEFDIAFKKENKPPETLEEFIKSPVGLDYRFVDVLPSYRVQIYDYFDLDVVDTYPLVTVTGSNDESINGNYCCINPNAWHTTDITARHPNAETYKQWENVDMDSWSRIGYIYPYWIIYDLNERECYRAYEPLAKGPFWDLEWVACRPGYMPIQMTWAMVEIHARNELPTNRFQYTHDINERNFIQRVAGLTLPKDLAKDKDVTI